MSKEVQKFYNILRNAGDEFSYKEIMELYKNNYHNTNKSKIAYRITMLVRNGYLIRKMNAATNKKNYKIADASKDYTTTSLKFMNKRLQLPTAKDVEKIHPSIVKIQDKEYANYPLSGKIYEVIRYCTNHNFYIRSAEVINYINKNYPPVKIHSRISRLIKRGAVEWQEAGFNGTLKTVDNTPFYLPRMKFNWIDSNEYRVFQIVQSHPEGINSEQLMNELNLRAYMSVMKILDRLRHDKFIKSEGTKGGKYYPLTNKNPFIKNKNGFYSRQVIDHKEPLNGFKYLNDWENIFDDLITKTQAYRKEQADAPEKRGRPRKIKPQQPNSNQDNAKAVFDADLGY